MRCALHRDDLSPDPFSIERGDRCFNLCMVLQDRVKAEMRPKQGPEPVGPTRRPLLKIDPLLKLTIQQLWERW